MNSILKFLPLLLLPSLLFAQPADQTQLIWGQELKEPGNSFLYKIITTNDTGIYALRKENSRNEFDGPANIYVEHYTPQMKLKRSSKIPMKYNKKRVEIEDVMALGGKMYMFTSFNNEAKQKNYLFAQELTKRLEPKKKLQKLAEIPTKNKANEGYFAFKIAKDSSKLLIYNQKPQRKKERESFTINIYDNQLNPLWEKEIKLPYPDKNVSIENYEIDNDGNVYLLATIFEKNKRSKRNTPNYRYAILSYRQDKEKVKEYPLTLGEKFITDLTFKIANNGHLVCAGFYSDKGGNNARGTCFFRLDPAAEDIYAKNTKAFSFEMRAADLSNKKKNKARDAEESGKVKKQAELKSFALDHLILRNDGGAVLVAEQYFVNTSTAFYDQYNPYRFNGYANGRTEFYYNYNDLIVANIQPNGEIEWVTRIPKSQETLNDGGYYSSYTIATVGSQLCFLFNDNKRNFERNDVDLHSFNGSSRNTVITLAKLSNDGHLEMYPLDKKGQDNLILRPKVSRQTGKRTMILFGENGRRFKLATLDFLQ